MSKLLQSLYYRAGSYQRLLELPNRKYLFYLNIIFLFHQVKLLNYSGREKSLVLKSKSLKSFNSILFVLWTVFKAKFPSSQSNVILKSTPY